MKNPFRIVTNYRAGLTFENTLENTLKGKRTRYSYLSVQRVHDMLKFAKLNTDLICSNDCNRKLYRDAQSALNSISISWVPKKVANPYYSVRNCQAFTDKHVVKPATFEQMCAAYDMDPIVAKKEVERLNKLIHD